jgi:hypothetical protein
MEPVSIGQAVGLAVVAGFGAWIGSYFSEYWKKKGEQAATHEDIDNVLLELRATTQATKEIEAKISGELWTRQKHWELKRQILFETAQKLAGILQQMMALVDAITKVGEKKEEEFQTKKAEWDRVLADFNAATIIVGFVCTEETAKAFDELYNGFDRAGDAICRRDIPDSMGDEFERIINKVKACIRREIEVKDQ